MMNNIQVQFRSLQKAYHYTTFQTAIKILESKSLRFGKLNNMNDFHENDKLCFVDSNKDPIGPDSFDVLEALQDEIYKYRQISFSVDSDNRKGFDLHQMWGLYAEKGDGVCFVFDYDELGKMHDTNIIYDKISYEEQIDSFVVSMSKEPNNVPNEIQTNVRSILFHKRKEWEHEQELRFLKRCPISQKEEYLTYGSSLKYIILSSKLQDLDIILFYQRIQKIKSCTNIPILVFGNGLLEYSLYNFEDGKFIWNSSNGYDILTPGVNCELDV